MSEQLYSAAEIASILGETRHWVIDRAAAKGSPGSAYHVRRGEGIQHLWTADGVDHWRAYHASGGSLPRRKPLDRYSDHKAVNEIANTTVTWKLWWQITCNGPVWWFSTPSGWWTSPDDGHSWVDTGLMQRPGDYRYNCVTGNVTPKGALLSVLRSAEKLRRRLEAV